MKAKKLTRFAAIKKFNNLIEYPDNINGSWQNVFNNDNPIVLELACGKAEYTIGMSAVEKNKNYIAIDIKGNRMFVGAKIALDENRTHVYFIRTRIENLLHYFSPNSVSEIWITFPDPFLKDNKAKNRLTHPKFLALYQKILSKNGVIHLKTDSDILAQFTLETIKHQRCELIQYNENIYLQGVPNFPLDIKTFYEQMHLQDNRIIQYISFTLPVHEILIPVKKPKNEEAII